MAFHLITCIVERGKGDDVVDAALSNGAQAATYFYAKGRGLKEKLGAFGKLILPEKEVVTIVTKDEDVDQIFVAVCSAAKLDVPGKGFAYVQSVEKCMGLVEIK